MGRSLLRGARRSGQDHRSPVARPGGGVAARASGSEAPEGAQPRLVEAVVTPAPWSDGDVIDDRRHDRVLTGQVERVPVTAERGGVPDVPIQDGDAGGLGELLTGGGSSLLDRL